MTTMARDLITAVVVLVTMLSLIAFVSWKVRTTPEPPPPTTYIVSCPGAEPYRANRVWVDEGSLDTRQMDGKRRIVPAATCTATEE